MLKAEDYLDVFVGGGMLLSNWCGPAFDIFFYRLHRTGCVSYFKHNVRGERTEHQVWERNVPTWCLKFSDYARPSVKLILLSNRFEKVSLLRLLPVDVARMIAKMVWATRKDPMWFFKN